MRVALCEGEATDSGVLGERSRESIVVSFVSSEKSEETRPTASSLFSPLSLHSHFRRSLSLREQRSKSLALLQSQAKKSSMRGLLSAARRTGVLGKSNAASSPGPPACRVPSAGLGFPLLEAQQKAADRLHRRRRPLRRLPLRATAAAEPSSSTASAAPTHDSECGEDAD